MYVTAAPIVNSVQWPQVRQSCEQYMGYCSFLKQKAATAGSRQQREAQDELEPAELHKKSFKLAQLKLPQDVQRKLTPDEIKKRYKKAGTLSNQKSAAATAWIVHHVGEPSKCPLSWAGQIVTSACFNSPGSSGNSLNSVKPSNPVPVPQFEGAFLQCGCIFKSTTTQQFYFSLGFRAWSVLAIQLEEITWADGVAAPYHRSSFYISR